MRPTSSAFADDGVIPRRFTCDGEDVSAPLAWSDVPPGVPALRCSAMIQKRPGTWRHWAIYDIPADRTKLAETPTAGL